MGIGFEFQQIQRDYHQATEYLEQERLLEAAFLIACSFEEWQWLITETVGGLRYSSLEKASAMARNPADFAWICEELKGERNLIINPLREELEDSEAKALQYRKRAKDNTQWPMPRREALVARQRQDMLKVIDKKHAKIIEAIKNALRNAVSIWKA